MANTHSIDLEASSSQYLEAADSASLSQTGDMTFECWVKFESLPASGSNMALASKWTSSGNQLSYIFAFRNNAGTYRWQVYNSSNGSAVSSASVNYTPSTGVWYHVAFALTASTGGLEVFVNGASVGTGTGLATSTYNSTAVFRIGQDDGSEFFDGLIDDVRLWNSVRTGTQILDNRNSELIGNETGLQAYWKLNNALTDSTSNGNTLTASGSPSFSATVPWYIVAHDASAKTTFTTNPSTTITCSGSNRLLVVVAGAATDNISGITYNSVALTQLLETSYPGSGYAGLSMWYLVAPDTGSAYTLSVSSSSACSAIAMSYTGVDQSTPFDSSAVNNNATGTTSLTVSTTVVGSNCWLVGGCSEATGAGATAGTGTTRRQFVDNGVTAGDSNATVGTGSQSLVWTLGTSNVYRGIIASIAPLAANSASSSPSSSVSSSASSSASSSVSPSSSPSSSVSDSPSSSVSPSSSISSSASSSPSPSSSVSDSPSSSASSSVSSSVSPSSSPSSSASSSVSDSPSSSVSPSSSISSSASSSPSSSVSSSASSSVSSSASSSASSSLSSSPSTSVSASPSPAQWTNDARNTSTWTNDAKESF